jgi:hypothetical protein
VKAAHLHVALAWLPTDEVHEAVEAAENLLAHTLRNSTRTAWRLQEPGLAEASTEGACFDIN